MQIKSWSWSISCIYSWICRHLTWTECVNVRINEWESPINRFNYVQFLRHFPGRGNQHVSSLSPTKEVQCEVQSPQAGAPGYGTAVAPTRNRCQKAVRSPGCNVPFLFLPAQVRDWIPSSSTSSMPDCLPDIPDHWSHLVWTSLILDLDINSFHHKYSLSAYHRTPLKCKGCCLVSQLSVCPLGLTQKLP